MQNMSGQLTTNVSVLQMLTERLAMPVEDADLQRATLHVLDWLACATRGAAEAPAAGFRAALLEAGAGECRVLCGARLGWWDALQLNAACGNLLEMDDLDRASILHPGPVIVPAAIAVAEKAGASGRALLMAIVRGYEATIRIGRALGTRHYAFFHNTSTCGAFGAAAAAASLLKLNKTRTAWALANAGSRTGGLWQMRHEACETKSLHNVQAAQTGVQSALLAATGVRGPMSLLEGPQGLFAALAPGAAAAEVLRDAQRKWLIHDVSFKPWPACRHAHPTIDAALALKTQVPDWRQIESVVVFTYKSALEFCDKARPQTELEAKFSLQHCAAVALVDGPPQLHHFALHQVNSEKFTALRNRVTVMESAELTHAFPAHYGARVELRLANGVTHTHLLRDARGDPEWPLTADDIRAKAVSLFRSATDRDPAALIGATESLMQLKLVREWTELWL
jgi:2-methylcitrate dehydratase PrpD